MRRVLLVLALVALVLPPRMSVADMFLYETKVVKTLIVCAHGVDCERAQRVFETARAYVRESVNLELKPVFVVELRENMSGPPETRMEKWQAATETLRSKYEAGATLVLLEPYPSDKDGLDFGVEDVLGMANDIGSIGRKDCLAYSKLMGSDRLASRILIHEIGHLLGGWHTNGLGIMAASATQNQYADSYAAESIAQMTDVVRLLP